MASRSCWSRGDLGEWCVALGAWHWLLLGALGVAAPGCATKTDQAVSSDRELGHAPTTPTACAGEVSIGGNWQQCANGMLHRATLGACPSALPRPRSQQPYAGVGTSVVADAGDAGHPASYIPEGWPCLRDEDCTSAPYGRCEPSESSGVTVCIYGCAIDSDCSGSSQVCVCGPLTGQCVEATCRSDTDCGDGMLCSSVTLPDCLPRVSCQGALDECAGDSDCSRELGEVCMQLGQRGSMPPRRVCSLAICPKV